MNINNLQPLALIAGPTASGKSALALALAELTPSIIINADSMQVYRDLRIITARPSQEEESRAPHRLFGHIDGAEPCSAARWAREATEAIAEAKAHNLLPILVGGTGLYIRTLLDGIAPIPDIDPEIRSLVRALPVADSHIALTSEDPEAAARIAPADTNRIARALEVIRSTGKPLSHWQQHREGGIADRVHLASLILLPPRDWLNERCDARFDTMFADGQDEVSALLARNLDPALPVMRAIGVPEIGAFQRGEMSESDVKIAGKRATGQYAKRQYTWFSRQSSPDWPRLETILSSNNIANIATILRNSLLTA
ncbi:tRNA (adenosine(37)-N6)-dimethylallyltransferase MiaA [Sphingomonas paeninsulae]|uniref:tRNA dimethylallyltransferase n=1 Tax=Sphingomonas paeninsulae TaxID=2319844 RepID=A0A494TE29_SPHPE|nr:tRNA (adenosine(37)-N6)-dimethylallyltransferase MiaA [Sphingomonas paeninsulae]AYJ87757.1 tRNA (adenosine(37)-N6)-dimethylallyltransferase MiaA [Sphingomonas paeninsulae]